jgi:hypothetical protein
MCYDGCGRAQVAYGVALSLLRWDQAHLVQFGLEVFQQADVFEVHTTPQVT